jgi:hypothetical protein
MNGIHGNLHFSLYNRWPGDPRLPKWRIFLFHKKIYKSIAMGDYLISTIYVIQ